MKVPRAVRWTVGAAVGAGAVAALANAPTANPGDTLVFPAGNHIVVQSVGADRLAPHPPDAPEALDRARSGTSGSGSSFEAVPVDEAALPGSAVVFIKGQLECTGWFYGPDIIATAGHCVNFGGNAKGTSGTWLDVGSLWVAAGAGPNSDGTQVVPTGESCHVERLYSTRGWVEASIERYDFGAIRVTRDCPLTRHGGWLGIGWTTASMTNTTIRVLGVRKTDLDDHPCTNLGAGAPAYLRCQWSSQVVSDVDGLLTYDVDTVNGTSGGPVVSTTCLSCVIGIHGWAPDGSIRHGAVLISKPVFETLVAWKNQAD